MTWPARSGLFMTLITCEPGSFAWRTHTIVAVATSTRSRASGRSLDGRASTTWPCTLTARLMNAVVASGHEAREWAQHFDTVSICFSKGLGAPVGSALAGSAEAIRRARRLRKLFGGGMRQAGMIAAGALFALENHVDRLSEDHANARLLADAFAGTEGFALESGRVTTNLVWVSVESSLGTAAEVAAYLRSRNILVTVIGAQVLRACTHLDVSREETEYAASVIRDIEPAMISAVTLVY